MTSHWPSLRFREAPGKEILASIPTPGGTAMKPKAIQIDRRWIGAPDRAWNPTLSLFVLAVAGYGLGAGAMLAGVLPALQPGKRPQGPASVPSTSAMLPSLLTPFRIAHSVPSRATGHGFLFRWASSTAIVSEACNTPVASIA